MKTLNCKWEGFNSQWAILCRPIRPSHTYFQNRCKLQQLVLMSQKLLEAKCCPPDKPCKIPFSSLSPFSSATVMAGSCKVKGWKISPYTVPKYNHKPLLSWCWVMHYYVRIQIKSTHVTCLPAVDQDDSTELLQLFRGCLHLHVLNKWKVRPLAYHTALNNFGNAKPCMGTLAFGNAKPCMEMLNLAWVLTYNKKWYNFVHTPFVMLTS